jgi:hypothetical protein
MLTDDLRNARRFDVRRRPRRRAGRALHQRRVPALRVRLAVRPRWLCVGRASRIESWRLIHDHDRGGAADRRPQVGQRQPPVGGVPAPRRTGVRRQQLLHLQITLSPLELRPRRSPARRPGDGHRGFDKKDFPLRLRVEVWKGSCSSTWTPMRRRSRRRSRPCGRIANYELDDAVCPGTFTHRPSLELEGDVQNFTTAITPTSCTSSSRLLPSNAERSRRLVDGGQRDLPHRRLHPHRRRLQHPHRTIMPVSWLTEGGTRSTLRARATTLCLGTAPDRASSSSSAPRRRTRSTSRSAHLFRDRPRRPDVRLWLALSDAGVQVFVRGTGTPRPRSAGCDAIRLAGAILLGRPRQLQPLAGEALPGALAGALEC